MKNKKVIGAVFTFAILLVAIMVLVKAKKSEEEFRTKSEIAQPQGSNPGVRQARPVPSRPLSGFWEASSTRKLELVTQIEHAVDWSESTRGFMKAAIQDKDLDVIVRNNMANGLLRQIPPDRQLDRLFFDMANDPSENEIWKDYAVQFMSQCYSISGSPNDIIANLKHFLQHGIGSQRATAALQLQNLCNQNNVIWEKDYTDELFKIVNDEKQPAMNRSTALSLLGDRSIPESLALHRQYIRSENFDLRRAAISGIGHLGGASDIALLDAALLDGGSSVQAAVNISKKMINKRLGEK